MVSGTLSPRVLGVVLAGGGARRFGSDKACAMLGGVSLIDRVCRRAAPQVDCLVINRAEKLPVVLASPYEILNDEYAGEGPLAGILAGLSHAGRSGYSHIATFSCDTPFFPRDVVTRQWHALAAHGATVCAAREGARRHHAFALLKTECAPALTAAFDAGLRDLRGIAGIVDTVEVSFPQNAEGPHGDAFFNINTVDDLALAGSWMAQVQPRLKTGS